MKTLIRAAGIESTPVHCLLRLVRQNLNPHYFLDGLMHLLKTNRFISVQFTTIFCERERAGPSLYRNSNESQRNIMRISMQSSLHAWLSMIEQCQDLLMEHQRMSRCLVDGIVRGGEHQENVIYYGTLQTTTEHYVVLCSKIQPTDEGIFQVLRVCCHPEVHHIRCRHLIFMTLSLLI
ncbi:hypothetical protein M405DRAFT_377536 [Rhizopogon salebrosus TDB-379]|nr:hypothetical protein M405DRAFT_377536 [Rhizopogon salebrosus TDB-379]